MNLLLRIGWKELREQLVFFIAIAALTAMLVASIAAVFSPRDMFAVRHDESIRSILITIVAILSATFAAVSSSLLFAGEKETGTASFLDTLPAGRKPLWLAKAPTGFALTIAQTSLLFALSMILRLPKDMNQWWEWLFVLFCLSVETYAWGLLTSTFCRSVLGSAGLSVVFLLLSWALATMIGLLSTPAMHLVHLALAAGAALASWRIYTARDRARHFRAGPCRPDGLGPFSWQVLLWLSWRQGRVFMAAVFIVAIPLGILFPWHGIWVYPICTLVIGVICGNAVLAGEQSGGANGFAGAQRLPIGRFWSVKVSFWLAIAAGAVCLHLLTGITSCFFHDVANSNTSYNVRNGLILWLQNKGAISQIIAPAIYALFWPISGFAFGVYFSQTFRKPIISQVVSAILAAVFVSACTPSLLCGGLAWWQLFLPSVVLVISSRLVMRPWLSGRMQSLRPMFVLTSCGLFAALWTAGSLWYRVAEIPDVGEPFDMDAFVRSLPAGDENRAGRLIREAVDASKQGETGKAITAIYGEPVLNLIREGGKGKYKKLYSYLDKAFEGSWFPMIQKASRMPPGMVEDPRTRDYRMYARYANFSHNFNLLLTARAAQLLERKQMEPALDLLLTSLRLGHQFRTNADSAQGNWVSQGDENTFRVLRRWLDANPKDSKLLRRLLKGLLEHEKKYPRLVEAVKINYLERQHYRNDFYWRRNHMENKLFLFLREVPWERERERRLINLLTAAQIWIAKQPAWKIRYAEQQRYWDWFSEESIRQSLALNHPENPASQLIASRWRGIFQSPHRFGLMHLHTVATHKREAELRRDLRALQIKTAQRLCTLENGRAPVNVSDLVPRYLPAIPINPLTGKQMIQFGE